MNYRTTRSENLLLAQLTAQQKQTYDAGCETANIEVPTKLEVMESPEGKK